MAGDELATGQLSEVAAAVKALAEVMRANGLSKINVELRELSIKLTAAGAQDVARAAPPATAVTLAREPAEAVEPVGYAITAPMIGTFYLSSSPNDPPFVRIGDRIEAGQTIGIIEAMKIMNEISADKAGTVLEILVTNAQPVEYGSALLRIELDGSKG